MLVIAVLLWWASPVVIELLATTALTGMVIMMALAIVGLLVVAAKVHRLTRRRDRRAPPAPPTRPTVDWAGSKRRFDTLRGEYAGYECNPLAVLRLPALADVTVASTARFVDAFAEAQALDTDEQPPPALAADYQRSVDAACRAWQAAKDAAERIRLAGLSAEERGSVQRVIKLLTMAERTGHEAERQAAYAKARDELGKLEQAGVLRLPRPASAALAEAARPLLPGTPNAVGGPNAVSG